MADPTKVKGARVQVFIDDADGPLEGTISPGNFNQGVPVLSGRYGATPVGILTEGHPGSIACEFLEQDLAQFKRALATDANGRALVAGTMMPTHVVRLHNPADADTTNDIVIPAAVFTNFQQTRGPTGVGGYTCDLIIVKPTADVPDYWIGYVEVPDPGDNQGGMGTAPSEPVP